jgi:hypothetical protein
MRKMEAVLEKILAPGILAVYGRKGDNETLLFTTHGLPLPQEAKDQWHSTLKGTCLLLATANRSGCGVDEVRVMLGYHTVLVQQCDGVLIGVVFVKGNGVVKSLARMVRRTFKVFGKTPNVEV